MMNRLSQFFGMVLLSVGLLACQNAPNNNIPSNNTSIHGGADSTVINDALSDTLLNQAITEQTTKSDHQNQKPIDFKGKNATAEEAKICQEQGGHIKRVGRAQFQKCIIAYADAGKVCQDKSDCQGKCVLQPNSLQGDYAQDGHVYGVCSADNNPFGCYVTINNGKPRGICVD